MKKNMHPFLYIVCFYMLGILLVNPLVASGESKETANIIKAFKVYHKGFEPPYWIKGFSKDKVYDTYCREATIYTTSEDKKLALKIATEREPVNITMDRSYDKNKLKEHFNWEYSAYYEYYKKHKKLPPQIAIFCKTPVIVNPQKGYESEEFNKNESIDIYVLNMIGTGLDSPEQPDYQYFIGADGGITDTKKQEMKNWYVQAFNMGFQCALDKKIFKRVVISQFGANNFARLYPGGKAAFVKEIWIPAFCHSLKAYKDRLKAGGINEISFMGEHLPPRVAKFVADLGLDSLNYGWIPGMFEEDGKLANKRGTTLFYNCWDPHTLVGNGNRGDGSLDGRFGRVAAMMALCWPLSNPHLTEGAIQTVITTPEMLLTTDTDNNNNQEGGRNYQWILLLLVSIAAIVVAVKIGLLEGVISKLNHNAQKQKIKEKTKNKGSIKA